VVAYWGQNGVSRAIADPTKSEKELGETCRDNPHYEAVVIAFVSGFKNAAQPDALHSINFSKHCNPDRMPLLCKLIVPGINDCQRLGKKVLISLGGATGSYGFASDDEARTFAEAIWNLYLGGQAANRPFATAVVDGVDLDIEGGSSRGYTTFVRRLRELMNGDKTRPWYITGAPQCIFPDAYLGPAAGRALGDVASLFDYLFVQFYNNACGAQNPDVLVSTFNQWTKVGPKILVGLPASASAGAGFVARAALPGLLGRVKGSPGFGGVMLWEASYDQNSAEGGMTYGAFVKRQLP
jgi:chitinase